MPVARAIAIRIATASLSSALQLAAMMRSIASDPLWHLVAGIGKPRYRVVPLGSKLVVKTRAVLADLFSSPTSVPAGADQASPAL
jgi:hypothetical protein